jgi:arylsulfatase A-like enzyme
VSEQVAVTMDWLPTLLSLAGATPHPAYPPDGIDLSATLRSPASTAERALFWRMLYRNQRSLRAGHWKYLSVEGNEFLFDLAEDSRERANRKHDEAARFAQMKAQWSAWNESMLPLPASQRPYFSEKDLAGYHP